MKTLTIQHLTKGTATGYPEKGWGGGRVGGVVEKSMALWGKASAG